MLGNREYRSSIRIIDNAKYFMWEKLWEKNCVERLLSIWLRLEYGDLRNPKSTWLWEFQPNHGPTQPLLVTINNFDSCNITGFLLEIRFIAATWFFVWFPTCWLSTWFLKENWFKSGWRDLGKWQTLWCLCGTWGWSAISKAGKFHILTSIVERQS